MISGTASTDAGMVMNSVFAGNGTYGINSDTTNYTASGRNQLLMDYNAFYNNTSGARNNVPSGEHDVTLTGDPFTNGGSLNFSLNNTANQGAALRGTGFPGGLQAGGTGYLDIGMLQHQDLGGSGGQKGYTFVAQKRPPANPELWALLHPSLQTEIFWPFPRWQTLGTLALAAAAIALRGRR